MRKKPKTRDDWKGHLFCFIWMHNRNAAAIYNTKQTEAAGELISPYLDDTQCLQKPVLMDGGL